MSESDENQTTPASGAGSQSTAAPGGSRKPDPPKPAGPEGEEDGMARMSFLQHLEELRSRLIKAAIGVAVAFLASLYFSDQLWAFVCQPAVQALTTLHFTPSLVQITPMEGFNIIWFKLPVLCAVFLASPWVLYQVWAFIAPGLYKKERRWAVPFVLCTAGLFLLGGFFAYFVVFRYGLTFLLGIGRGNYVTPMVSMTEYFDLFVNVMLGVGVVFELPILIFFLTLLHLVKPAFLVRHSRYAILAIFLIAAIVTPTPDVFNLMLFAVPMILLFYVGVFAGYLLTLRREHQRFPWGIVAIIILIVLAVCGLIAWALVSRYGYHLVQHWPFFTR